MKQFIVAITGASGGVYALRLLHKLLGTDCRVTLTMSEAGALSLGVESGVALNPLRLDKEKLLRGCDLGNLNEVDTLQVLAKRLEVANVRDIGAKIASGSTRHDGMVIVPCSMGTLARVATGLADNLIARAADVTLKERRKLILVTREMPLSLIHLQNMTTVTQAGATVMHACPHFYHRPQTVVQVLDTVVDRILDHLEVEIPTQRWKENS